MFYLLLFLIIAGVMIFFAKRLTVSGENLGDVLGLDASWVGVLLLASITSLPELIVGIGASVMGNQSMAVANIFGSNVFNLFIIFLLEVFILKGFFFITKIDTKENMKLSMLVAVLTAIFLVGLVFKDLSILGQSPFILAIFFFYLKLIKGEGGNGKKKKSFNFNDIKKPLMAFTLDSIGVVALGLALSKVADLIAVTPIMGVVLGQSIVGAILLAVATSLPELTVSFESVRRGSCEQAIGNILGSNLFNMSTLLVIDLFTKGSLLKSIGGLNLSTIYICLVMHIIFYLGLLLNKKKVSLVVGGLYMLSLYFII